VQLRQQSSSIHPFLLRSSRLLSRTPAKHCQVDPVPTWLVNRVAVILAPVLSLMYNASLRSGQFPDSHKHAVVFPRLKNHHSILTIWTHIGKYWTSVSFRSSKESLHVDLSIMQNAMNCFQSSCLSTAAQYWVCCRKRHECYHPVYLCWQSRSSHSTRPQHPAGITSQPILGYCYFTFVVSFVSDWQD